MKQIIIFLICLLSIFDINIGFLYTEKVSDTKDMINDHTPNPLNLIDPTCILTGRPSRDAAENHNLFNLRRQQMCKLQLSSSPKNPGVFTYAQNSNAIFLIQSAIIIISKDNLDKGTLPNQIGYVYAMKLNQEGKNILPGQILGSRLGGPGNELSNLFPQSPVMKPFYDKYEDQIYNCLNSGVSKDVTLRWTFYYRTGSIERPYKITYQANFRGWDSNTPQQCQKSTMSFEN